MKKVTELTVRRPLDGGAAALGGVAAALGGANLNILALTAGASSAGRIMNIRILVENPARGAQALKAAKIRVAQNEALSLTLENRPGALAEVADKLGQAGVKIKAIYAAGAGDAGVTVLSVSNVAKAQAALSK